MKMNPLAFIRTGRTFKYISAFVAINIVAQCVSPTIAFALTSGPAQEEFASFEPATTTDMVDLYSGDFNYNIPLLSVPGPNGGYPINLAYHSGVGMEQEASWVGLGWNLNVGAINRQLRGLPDDAYGDEIKQKMKLKPNTTISLNIDTKKHEEFFGVSKDKPSTFSYQVYYNTYKGLGARIFANVSRETKNNVASVGLGISYDSQEGLGIEANMGLQAKHNESSLNFNLGASYNSRGGLYNFSVSSSAKASKGGQKMIQHHDGFNQVEYKDVAGAGYKSASSISYSTNHSVPTVSIPMRTEAYPFDIKISSEISGKTFGLFKYQAPLAWTGSVSTSKVAYGGDISTTAYGYLYTADANANPDAMTDFQRSQISYSKRIPNLPPSSFTYDLYTQTGQGTGSMFRPYYSSVGSLSTARQSSEESQNRLNLEVGAGTSTSGAFIVHLGAGLTNISGSTTSGRWSSNDELITGLNFTNSNGNYNYEPFYFKQYGEKSGVLLVDDQLKYKWGGDEAVRVKLGKTDANTPQDWLDREFETTKIFVKSETGASLFTAGDGQKYRKQREARSSNIEMLTDEQALIYGGKEAQYGYNGTTPNKTFNHGKKISEISIVQPDGMRYTYGLPAYNMTQTEALFAVDGDDQPENNNNIAVPHTPGTEDIVPYGGNITDEFLSQTTMATPYAHSWLLTSVVSADYIDINGDGPSSDDYGYWVKFDYQKTATNYKWRIPYTGANYIQGKRGDFSDDKGSFTYGEKEIYMLNSVSTKTHIALFDTESRLDALQAYNKMGDDENVTAAYNPMKYLTKIKLYAKDPATDRYDTPIKTVVFNYSYTLCNKTQNSTFDSPKLTLNEVYFTYQHSDRGALSPYKFKYGNTTSNNLQNNPEYNINNMDRWGNFKNNSVYERASGDDYPYVDFPYTEQDTRTDGEGPTNIAPWTLRQIELPTGGTINVKYESDDYAYVEARKAAHMFDIIGIGIQLPVAATIREERNSSTAVFAETERLRANGNYKVFFRMDRNLNTMSNTNGERDAYIAGHFKDMGKMYFKIYAELTPGKYDYVTGYADAAGGGWVSGDIGFVYLKAVDLKKYKIVGQEVNPFTKAAIQHLRLSRPELVYNVTGMGGGDAKNQILNLVGSVGTFFNDIMTMIQGFNTWAFSNNFGQRIRLNGRSVIRLTDPDGIKYGGGIRVKRISISDNWDVTNQDITNASTGAREYGQEYDYKITEEGQLISSGVAYEPQVGGEESALRTPIEYEESVLLGTTSNLSLDNPILEDYYPGASVGYRKVTVKSIAPQQADLSDNNQIDNSLKIEKSTAPQTIYEFYTPKDFPVVFDQTDINADPAIVRPVIIPGVYSSFKKRLARSQGYSIVLNDAAGKLKSVTHRTSPTETNKEGAFISKEEYIYNTEAPYSADRINKLSDKVQVLELDDNHEPVYRTAVLGQSHDVFIDMNENKQESSGIGLDLNLDLKVLKTVPYIIPWIMPIPYASDFEASMRTVVTVKVVHRSAIIKEVITTTGESVMSKENLAYDIQNGKPLLTKVTNEFKDPIYQFAYPAHWYYSNMGGAYKNYGIYIGGISATAASGTYGQVILSSGIPVNDYFTKGDEVLVNNQYRAHIYEINSSLNSVNLINRDGGYYVGSVSSLKIITSGRKNLLEQEAGGLASKELIGFNQEEQIAPVNYSFSKIIDASAIVYNDQWEASCNTCGNLVETNSPSNPYIRGESGIWRPFRSYAYKTNRVYTTDKAREDGIYADFVPFKWYSLVSNSSKWIVTNTVTKYSPYGFELENENAIGNYSSALYGFHSALTVAVAKNAQYKEIAVDGFEDYRWGNCQEDHHFNFSSNAAKITPDEKHTGRYSMRLKPGEKVEVEAIMQECQHN